jgi:sugar lactone lactonase YvrE
MIADTGAERPPIVIEEKGELPVSGEVFAIRRPAVGESALLAVLFVLASLGIWTSDGCAASLTASAAQPVSANISATPSATLTPDPKLALFVTNNDYLPSGSPPVTAYPLGSSGNIAPLSPGTGSSATKLYHPSGIARDSNGNLYATNASSIDSVTVYAASATGDASPIATIQGGNTLLADPHGIALDSKGNIYVANQSISSITVFAAGSNGDVGPTATITGSATGLANPTGIALDSSGNIYVANSDDRVGGYSITIYPAGSDGNVKPSATISGSSTGLALPWGIALGPDGKIYVANFGSGISDHSVRDSITVYAPGSNGNVAPIATIVGDRTGLNSPGGIAIDSVGNIYVTNDVSATPSGGDDKITVYARGSNGNAAPKATLYALGLRYPIGILVDSGGNLYVANTDGGSGTAGSIVVYPPSSLVPSKAIGLETALDGPSGITVDGSGTIYVTNQENGNGELDSVNVYTPGSYAEGAPSAAIVGTRTKLAQPFGIATDSHGNLYVANAEGGPHGQGSITVYPTHSMGNVAPSATITGDKTGLSSPSGIALDLSGKLYVANVNGGPDSNGSITIYPAGSSGNVTPIATISDDPSCRPCDKTGLSSPQGVAVDSSGKIYAVNVTGGGVTIYPPVESSRGILNQAPSATITGTKNGPDLTGGITLDSSGNIYVTDNVSYLPLTGGTNLAVGGITVYSAGSNGNVTPIATISGSNTELANPRGIAIGPIAEPSR